MGSHPTLDHQQLAAEARQLDPNDWTHGHAAVTHLATAHPQVPTWPDDNPDLAHHLDHRDWNYDHAHPSRERAAEQAFDRLNPEFGVPADRTDRIGHRDLAQRERPGPRRPGGRPRQPPERPHPGHLAARPGLPHGRRSPRRPHPAHPRPARPRAGRPRTLTTSAS
jgi:hypothetical protein